MSEERQQKEIFKDKATQEMLNKPLEADGSFSAEDEQFLDMLLSLIGEGKIDLYKPASLMNEEVYNVTTDELRGRADFEALQMLATIREIKDLCDNDMRETKQVENLVYRLRMSKERFEAKEGDLFII